MNVPPKVPFETRLARKAVTTLFFTSLGVLSHCMRTLISDRHSPCSCNFVNAKAKSSVCVDASLGMSGSDTAKIIARPWTNNPTMCALGRANWWNSFDLRQRCRGYANFAWTIPSQIIVTVDPPARDNPLTAQYCRRSWYCESRWAWYSSICFCLATRWWPRDRMRNLCLTQVAHSGCCLSDRNFVK